MDMAWWIQAWVYSKGGYWLWGSFINQKRTLPREVFMQAKGKKMRQYEETKVAKGVRIKEQIIQAGEHISVRHKTLGQVEYKDRQ